MGLAKSPAEMDIDEFLRATSAPQRRSGAAPPQGRGGIPGGIRQRSVVPGRTGYSQGSKYGLSHDGSRRSTIPETA